MPFDRRTFLKGLITFPFGVDILKQFTDTIIENEKKHPENDPKIKWRMEIYSGSIPAWAHRIKYSAQAVINGFDVAPVECEPTGDLLAHIDAFAFAYNPNFKTYFLEEPVRMNIVKTGTMGYFIIYRNERKFIAGTIGTAGADMNVSSLSLYAEVVHQFYLETCTIRSG